MSLPFKIGIILGSARQPSNCQGVAKWVRTHLASVLEEKGQTGDAIREIVLWEAPLPLGPYLEATIPSHVTGAGFDKSTGITTYPYADPKVQQFSQLVQSLSALIVVTPQYNWSVPGELKNTFDQIFPEWKDLPVMAVNYGGRGGGKCAVALEAIFGGTFMKTISCGDVCVPLPTSTFGANTPRVQGNEEFFNAHETVLREKLGLVVDAAVERKQAKLAAAEQA